MAALSCVKGLLDACMSVASRPMGARRRSDNRPTLADVAARAGVSAITVSRALREPGRVSPAARAEVERAVRALGYERNAAAAMLASGRSDIVGLVIPSVTNHVFADVLRGVYDALENTAHPVQIGNFRYAPMAEERLLTAFRAQRPAGLIVAGTDQSPGGRAALEAMECPVVQIMDVCDDPVDMLVGLDHAEGAALAARHLADRGYRAPGLLAARMDPRTRKRAAGFEAAATGFDPRRRITTPEPSSVQLGGRMLASLLARAPETDAVFCINDDLALGAAFEAARMGLGVPGRLGIAGFNDLEYAAAAEPALTSVATPRYEMGRMAAEMLLARIAGADVPSPRVLLRSTLHPRASTAREPAP